MEQKSTIATQLPPSTLHGRVDRCRCRAIVHGEKICIGAQSDIWARVPEPFSDPDNIDPARNQLAGVRVPRGVEGDPPRIPITD